MFQKPNVFFRRDTFRRGGFSLLEVAIALVIFVIGALAIIRIFPGALNVVQGSGNRNIAVNLNRGTLSKFAQEAGSVARGIFQSDSNNGVWNEAGAISVAGTPRRNYSLPRNTVQDVSDSALGKFRYVFEEGQKVRGQSGNLFVLTNHAIRPGSAVVISEEDMVDGVVIKADGELDFTDARFRNADIPLSDPALPSRPAAPFRGDTAPNDVDYYVSYRYKRVPSAGAAQRVESVEEEPLFLTATWGILLTPPRVAQASILDPVAVPGQVEVRFVRKSLVTAPAVSTNPSSIAGLLSLDSSAQMLTKGRLIAPNDNLRVSYACDAWNWLINDEVAAQETDVAGTLSAILPVKFIDNEPATFYSTATPVGAVFGVRQSYVAAGTSPPIGSVEIESSSYNEDGTVSGNLFLAAGTARAQREAFNAGRVLVDEVPINGTGSAARSNTSPSLRVAYRTRDAWAHQVSVAPSTYTRSTNGLASSQPWRDFYVGSDNYIYFHASEAGKTFQLSYKYVDPSVAAPAPASTDKEVNARIFTVEEDIIDLPSTVPLTFTPAVGTPPRRTVSRARLTDLNGDALTSPVTAITSIEGLSVQIRTAWLEGSRFTQSSLTGYRQEDTQ